MFNLDEAIKHCEEVAEENEKKASWFWDKEGNPNYESCVKCASEHRQLAEWLKELKMYREILTELDAAIECYENCESCQGFREYPTSQFIKDIIRIIRKETEK